LGGAAAGLGYARWATAPTSFVIATDIDKEQVVRLDLVTLHATVLLSNKVLPVGPDSLVFISDTKILIDFPYTNNGEIGIGDIQTGTYTTVAKGLGGELRDMALRPDGRSVLIADKSGGNILEFHVGNRSITTFAQNLSGIQGLAFDADSNLFAAVGSQVVQLDPASGKQIKIFDLLAGSDGDGMAYDRHRNTLDIALLNANAVVSLDPKTGKVSTLIDSISAPDGVAIDRQGNLFIASDKGVMELNTNNQLLNVSKNAPSAGWDDVTPLSGSGSASY
jgi:streptogramin lyase